MLENTKKERRNNKILANSSLIFYFFSNWNLFEICFLFIEIF
jgi:hypothetical protein